MADDQWGVYLVRCSDNSLYCGVTNNLENRLAAHNAGKGTKYTKSRRPVTLECVGAKFKLIITGLFEGLGKEPQHRFWRV